MAAEAACTIPHASGDRHYKDFNCTVAKGMILGDAGAVLQADAPLAGAMAAVHVP